MQMHNSHSETKQQNLLLDAYLPQVALIVHHQNHMFTYHSICAKRLQKQLAINLGERKTHAKSHVDHHPVKLNGWANEK